MFEDKEFDENLIAKNEGFVYLITNKLTGKQYIGRKYFFSLTKKKGKRNKVRAVSKWKDYYGSSKTLKSDIEALGKDSFKREILCICSTRGDTNRMEIELLWQHKVLDSDQYYNESIGHFKTANEKTISSRIYSTKLGK